MKIEKKHIIFGGLFVVSSVAALAYWQYKKMLNYCLGLNRLKVNAITTDLANIDIFLNFENKSDVAINILSQEYNVYVGGGFITKVSNSKPQLISPNSTSIIAVNVKFNPTKAGQNILNAILSMGNTAIKIDIKLKVKLWMFTINIPYTYNTSLKELLTPSTEPKKDKQCHK